MALPESDRADIAAELLASLPHPEGGLEIDSEEWLREIERRARSVVSGETELEDWDTVETADPGQAHQRVKVGLDPRASAELDEAAAWYEGRRGGLGTELVDEVRAAVTAIGRGAGAGSPVEGLDAPLDVRRVRVHRFPYQVVYMTLGEEIVVIAVAHDRRLPAYWAARTEPS